jgi:hypothetical protein
MTEGQYQQMVSGEQLGLLIGSFVERTIQDEDPPEDPFSIEALTRRIKLLVPAEPEAEDAEAQGEADGQPAGQDESDAPDPGD